MNERLKNRKVFASVGNVIGRNHFVSIYISDKLNPKLVFVDLDCPSDAEAQQKHK